jgi:serine/threonine protein kinase
MLVIDRVDMNLREYLQKNHNQLTWKERIWIIRLIINALCNIHEENLIHRDLHSGNILYLHFNNGWYISDLGFCGPADKPTTGVYGNLPYIAPEVLRGKEYTYKSDIYSVAILMWEISFGQPPFVNHEHNSILTIKIANGMRPKILSEIPSEYKNLMEQCWDADPSKRPDINTLYDKVEEVYKKHLNAPNESSRLKITINEEISYTSNNIMFTSKFHKFKNLPELRSATEGIYIY